MNTALLRKASEAGGILLAHKRKLWGEGEKIEARKAGGIIFLEHDTIDD